MHSKGWRWFGLVWGLSACGGGGIGSQTSPNSDGGPRPNQNHDSGVTNDPPVDAKFFATTTMALAGNLIEFDATTSQAPATAVFAWDFGDGTRGTGRVAYHRYLEAGDYTVILTVQAGTSKDIATTVLRISGRLDTPATVPQATLRIVDTAGAAVRNAQVRLPGRDPILVGSSGVTTLSDLNAAEPIGLEITAPGFAHTPVRLTLSPRHRADVEVVLLHRPAMAGRVDADQGGTISDAEGATIQVGKEAFIDSLGRPISGDVEIYFTSVDVSDPLALRGFPGGQSAVDADGDETLLLSFGATEVALISDGEEVELRPGTTATLKLPLFVQSHPNGNPIQAGDTIPLWSLDDRTGQWIYETEGVVEASPDSPTGLVLAGKVSHFSWWNADIPANNAALRTTIVLRGTDGSTIAGPTGDTATLIAKTAATGPRILAQTTVPYGRNEETLTAPGNILLELEAYGFGGTMVGTATVFTPERTVTDVTIVLEPLGEGGGPIPNDEEQNAALSGEGDTAVWTVEAQSGDLYELEVRTGIGSSAAGIVTIETPSTTTIATTPFTPATPAQIGFQAQEDGLYTIRIAATNDDGGGYRVRLINLGNLEKDGLKLDAPWGENLAPLASHERRTYLIYAHAGDALVVEGRVGVNGAAATLELLSVDGTVETRVQSEIFDRNNPAFLTHRFDKEDVYRLRLTPQAGAAVAGYQLFASQIPQQAQVVVGLSPQNCPNLSTGFIHAAALANIGTPSPRIVLCSGTYALLETLNISAEGTQITAPDGGVTINGTDEVLIRVNAPNVSISDLNFDRIESLNAAVDILAAGSQIQRNWFEQLRGITGQDADDAIIEDNTFRLRADNGLDMLGDDIRVTGNRFNADTDWQQPANVAVRIRGDRTQVSSNIIGHATYFANSFTTGIVVEGENTSVIDNQILRSTSGISVNAATAQIDNITTLNGNIVNAINGYGIRVGDIVSASLNANTVDILQGYGILFQEAGGVLTNNMVRLDEGSGFRLEPSFNRNVDGIQLINNTVGIHTEGIGIQIPSTPIPPPYQFFNNLLTAPVVLNVMSCGFSTPQAFAANDFNLVFGFNREYCPPASPGANALIVQPILDANFRPMANSPAIDAASPVVAPSSDIDGDPRPLGSGPDIGADEVE